MRGDKMFKNKEKRQPINIDGIKRIVNVIEEGNPYTNVERKEISENYFEMGYVSYHPEITSLFNYFSSNCKDYRKNIEKIKLKEISKLKLKEVDNYLTFIYRGERFSEGFISTFIDNGILLKLLNRLLEIFSK